MLLTSKAWNCANVLKDCDAGSIVESLLTARGIVSDEKKKDFLSVNPSEWYDPFLFKDMDKAVEIIVSAIRDKKKILIYGDYDADGVTATSIMVRYFRSHDCNVDYIVPQRAAHGYGLTDYIIDDVLEKKPDLLITVDCGISNMDTITSIKEKGITVIVTDHHNVPEELPPADAVICAKRKDNTYPCIDLCGAGVAMKVVEAMGRDGRYKVYPNVWKQVIELSGIATIADLVPVVSENRTLVKKAFQSMREPTNCGVRVMNELLLDRDKDPDESYISFVFVPRINAAGRLYDSSDALTLFLSDDCAKAKKAAENLTRQNDERKAIEASVFEEARTQIEDGNRPEEWLLTNTKGPIVAYGKNWHQGVLGIVAGKLSQHFRRSAIVFTEDGLDPTNVKGSSRSYGEFDIYNAIMSASEYTVNFGGHKKAAGLVVKKNKLKDFMKALEKYSCDNLDPEADKDELLVDCEIPADCISMEVHESLRKLSPFGLGNGKPVFVTRGLLLSSVQFMSDGAHLRLELYDTENDPDMKKPISAVGFGMGNYSAVLRPGDRVDIAYTMNIFKLWGNDTLSLHLSDIKPSLPESFVWKQPDTLEKLYESGLAIDQIVKLSKGTSKEDMIPTSQDFGDIYKVIREMADKGIAILDLTLLTRAINIKCGRELTPFCVLRALEVFKEAKLIKLGKFSSCRICLNLIPVKDKVDLHETATYKRLYGNE